MDGPFGDHPLNFLKGGKHQQFPEGINMTQKAISDLPMVV